MSLTDLVNKVKSDKTYILGIPVPSHYVLLIFLCVVVFYGLRSWINQANWKTLVHDQYRFSIDYPANWKYYIYGERGSHNLHDLKARISTNSLGFLGPISKGFMIFWIPVEEPTLVQAAEWGLEELPRYQSTFSDLQETQIGAGNYPALTRTFHYDNSFQMSIHYYVVRDNGAYLLEFYLNNENDAQKAAPIFERMLASFHMFD